MFKLSSVLSLRTQEDIDVFLKTNFGLTLNEKNIEEKELILNWKFLGDNPSNASSIDIIDSGEKGIIERITNAIDAVIEKKVSELGLVSPKSQEVVVKKAFPKYYEKMMEILNGGLDKKNYAADAENFVTLAISDGRSSNKPTFDIVDLGIGIEGFDFENTILSLHRGNKIKSDKSYLIGTFGQGGSSSLSLCSSTLIISKKNNRYFFTIVRSVDLKEYKGKVYVYLTDNSKIMELSQESFTPVYEFENSFSKSDSGTLIRMISTDVKTKYRNNPITKPNSLWDLINTELFDVRFPVKVIENRRDFRSKDDVQNRNSFGSHLRIKTSKYYKREYSGNFTIDYSNRPVKIEYYSILPEKETEWGLDSECSRVFELINVHAETVIYLVNGQYIKGEGYTKIKNKGLPFLKNRLLVVVNLDELGKEKFDFFTTDRSRIKDTDWTRGLFETVVDNLVANNNLISLNDNIAEKVRDRKIDVDVLESVSKRVKNLYKNFKIPSEKVFIKEHPSTTPTITKTITYNDFITSLLITNKKENFFSNQKIILFLKTNANRATNNSSRITMYINDVAYYDYTVIFLSGAIQYNLDSKLSSGNYMVRFEYITSKSELIESNNYNFNVLEDKIPEETDINNDLNLEIVPIVDSEYIVDLIKNKDLKKITVNINLSSPLLSEIYGKTSNQSNVELIKNYFIDSLVLHVLLLDEKDYYSSLETNQKNNLALALIKSVMMKFNHDQN
jgi:hypothetical protein